MTHSDTALLIEFARGDAARLIADDREFRTTRRARGTLIGAGIGATAGGLVGRKYGSGVIGAVAGGYAGGLAGMAVGRRFKKDKADPQHPITREAIRKIEAR